jgi:Protein of unknown function (DUF2624)
MVKQKLKQLTPEQLIQYGKEYGFYITKNEAYAILKYVNSTPLDIFNEADRYKLLKKLAQITNEETAKKAYQLFQAIVKQYGIEHLF